MARAKPIRVVVATLVVLLPLLLAWGCGGGSQPRGGGMREADWRESTASRGAEQSVVVLGAGQPSEGALAEQADHRGEPEQPDANVVDGADDDERKVENVAAGEYPFNARAMRFHPFTRVRRTPSNSNEATGASPLVIEARLEFFDQFGDPTKAIGRLRFELYESEPGSAGVPIPGRRLMQWDPAFDVLETNATYYDNITRTYVFRLDTTELDLERLPNNAQCVMIATFHTNTRRMAAQFDLEMLR